MRAQPCLWLSASALFLLLAACVHHSPEPIRKGDTLSSPADFKRPQQDGKPDWQVDVAKIPDAVPQPHNGTYKNAPYQVFGKTYYPLSVPASLNYREVGLASWYGTQFHSKQTSNGEIFDLYGMTAAHKTLPLPSYVRVTNLANGKNVILRVNDRGPFHSDRIIDLSYGAAMKLGYAEDGVARVQVEVIDPKQWQAKHGRLVLPKVAANDAPDAAQVAAHTPDYGAKKNLHEASGLYLQVAAFLSLQTAEQLKQRLSQSLSVPIFISPLAIDGQILHRIRLGPIPHLDDAKRLQQEVERLGLGLPLVVRP